MKKVCSSVLLPLQFHWVLEVVCLAFFSKRWLLCPFSYPHSATSKSGKYFVRNIKRCNKNRKRRIIWCSRDFRGIMFRYTFCLGVIDLRPNLNSRPPLKGEGRPRILTVQIIRSYTYVITYYSPISRCDRLFYRSKETQNLSKLRNWVSLLIDLFKIRGAF